MTESWQSGNEIITEIELVGGIEIVWNKVKEFSEQ